MATNTHNQTSRSGIIARILSLGIKAEVLQLTFCAGAIAGMLLEAALMVAAMSGFPLAHMMGRLL